MNTPQFAHVGFAEGIPTIKGILGEPADPIDYSRVAWCISCHPEVAYAGLTKAEARRRGIDIAVKKYPMGDNSRAQILDDVDGVVKIVVARHTDGSTGALLGVHLIGPWATQQLGQGYMAGISSNPLTRLGSSSSRTRPRRNPSVRRYWPWREEDCTLAERDRFGSAFCSATREHVPNWHRLYARDQAEHERPRSRTASLGVATS